MEDPKIVELLQTLVRDNEELKNQITDQKTAITLEIRALKQDLCKEIADIKQENCALKNEVKELKTKLNRVERDSKKYKLIVHGLEEQQDNLSDLRGCLDLINNRLGVECRFTDIRNFYRFGQPSSQKHRIASLELINYFHKVDILKNCKKLKGTNIFITPDFTEEEQADQKLLYEHLKAARQSNQRAFIKNKILIVDGKQATVEELRKKTINLSATGHIQGSKVVQKPTQESNKRKTLAEGEDISSQQPKRALRSGSTSSHPNKQQGGEK